MSWNDVPVLSHCVGSFPLVEVPAIRLTRGCAFQGRGRPVAVLGLTESARPERLPAFCAGPGPVSVQGVLQELPVSAPSLPRLPCAPSGGNEIGNSLLRAHMAAGCGQIGICLPVAVSQSPDAACIWAFVGRSAVLPTGRVCASGRRFVWVSLPATHTASGGTGRKLATPGRKNPCAPPKYNRLTLNYSSKPIAHGAGFKTVRACVRRSQFADCQ